MSLPEVLIWRRLRSRQTDYRPIRRQHGVGPYIIDFYCSELKLAIEVDGICHASEAAAGTTGGGRSIWSGRESG